MSVIEADAMHDRPGGGATLPPASEARLPDSVDRIVAADVHRAAAVLAVLLVGSGAACLLLLPASQGRPLAGAAVVSLVALVVVWRARPNASGHALGAALAALALANLCTFLFVTGDARAMTLVAAIPFACAWIYLSRSWMAATAAGATLGFAATSEWAAIPDNDWSQGAVALVAGLGVGILVHESRLRAWRRLEACERREALARAELEESGTLLRRDAEHMRQLADASSEGVILHESGRILDANRAAVELLGRPVSDLAGHSLSSLLLRNREGQPATLQALGRPFEASVLLPDGTPLAVELRTGTVPLEGRVASAVTLRDITSRKREREALDTRRALESLVTRIAAEFVKLPPRLLDQGIEQAIEAIGRLIGADHGNLLQLGQHGALRRVCEWYAAGVVRPSPDRPEPEARATPWLARRIAALEAVHIPDVDGLPPQASVDKATLSQSGFKSLITVPIAHGNRILGLLTLASLQRCRTWTDETVALLRIAGEILASALMRQRALQDLEASEGRKAAILEAALDCIITTDPHGCVVEWNPAAEKTFGRRRRQAVGLPLRDLILPTRLHRADVDSFGALFAAEGGSRLGKRIETTACRADGSEFPAELALVPMKGTAAAAFTLYLRDITDRHEIDRLREELIATVSHELRTPLTSLRGFAELMLERDFPPERRQKFLNVIRNEALRLTQLVNDFLDLKRIEGGHAALRLDRIDVRTLVRETETLFRRDDGPHTFELALDPALTLVECDPGQIRRLLSNLVSNAVKFSPQGGAITMGARNEADGVVLWVSDQGIGIPAEAMERLFAKFYRVDNAETRSIGGTGLGLALVKEIATAHGGRVWVESRPGVGSTFSVLLPTRSSADLDTSEPSYAIPREATWRPTGTDTGAPMRDG